MQKFENEYYLNGIKARDNEVLKSIYKEFLGAVTSFVVKTKDNKRTLKTFSIKSFINLLPD